MGRQISPQILGATAIGLALVLGAYTFNSIGKPLETPQPASTQQALKAPSRMPLPVTDSNRDGVEDWRDEFITTKPIVIDRSSIDAYTPPTTLTGQTSIDFFTDTIQAKLNQPFGLSQEAVFERITDKVARSTEQTIYTLSNITILEEWDEVDVLNYANTVAASLIRHNNNNLRHEVEIMNQAILEQQPAVLDELKAVGAMYQSYRDDLLLIPVPKIMAKEHLDLINTFEAVAVDISAMRLVFDDPLVTLMRLKRYDGDTEGMRLALQNMYNVLLPYTKLLKSDDPANIFVLFNSNYQAP